jgi:hypothetical protein
MLAVSAWEWKHWLYTTSVCVCVCVCKREKEICAYICCTYAMYIRSVYKVVYIRARFERKGTKPVIAQTAAHNSIHWVFESIQGWMRRLYTTLYIQVGKHSCSRVHSNVQRTIVYTLVAHRFVYKDLCCSKWVQRIETSSHGDGVLQLYTPVVSKRVYKCVYSRVDALVPLHTSVVYKSAYKSVYIHAPSDCMWNLVTTSCIHWLSTSLYPTWYPFML